MEADYIVDIGPGAGSHGGEVVAHGTAEEIMKNRRFTDRSVFKRQNADSGSDRRAVSRQDWLTVQGAQENNLKNIDVKIPTGRIYLCDRRIRFR